MLYHSNSTGPDPQAFSHAVDFCHQLATNSTNQFKICHHTIGNVKHRIIRDKIGDQLVKNLSKNKQIQFNGVTILLETERIINNTQMIILAPHVNPKYLDKLILKNGGAPIIYIPWTQEELNRYIAKYPNSTPI